MYINININNIYIYLRPPYVPTKLAFLAVFAFSSNTFEYNVQICLYTYIYIYMYISPSYPHNHISTLSLRHGPPHQRSAAALRNPTQSPRSHCRIPAPWPMESRGDITWRDRKGRVCVCVCCICIYVCIYVYTCMYIYIYIHIIHGIHLSFGGMIVNMMHITKICHLK